MALFSIGQSTSISKLDILDKIFPGTDTVGVECVIDGNTVERERTLAA